MYWVLACSFRVHILHSAFECRKISQAFLVAAQSPERTNERNAVAKTNWNFALSMPMSTYPMHHRALLSTDAHVLLWYQFTNTRQWIAGLGSVENVRIHFHCAWIQLIVNAYFDDFEIANSQPKWNQTEIITRALNKRIPYFCPPFGLCSVFLQIKFLSENVQTETHSPTHADEKQNKKTNLLFIRKYCSISLCTLQALEK